MHSLIFPEFNGEHLQLCSLQDWEAQVIKIIICGQKIFVAEKFFHIIHLSSFVINLKNVFTVH